MRFPLTLILLISLSPVAIGHGRATCYGHYPCKACKTCEYCKHCNEGGACGVCRKKRPNIPPRASSKAKQALKKSASIKTALK
jgi:hypothetical protein